MSMSAWQPLLAGDEAARARRIAVDIADQIDRERPDTAHADPFVVLLDAYLAKVLDSDRHADRALDALARLFDGAGALRLPSLHGGVAGLGWTAAHVTSLLGQWIEADDTDPCEPIDDLLDATVTTYPAGASYDLISGLTGIATYAIERLPRERPRQLLVRIVDLLAASMETSPDGLTWHTPATLLPPHQRKEAPDGYYNLGVAHGVPAVAVVLARAASLGIRTPLSGQLLEGTTRWILAQQQASGPGARYASWIPKDQTASSEITREAWCYGGLGVAVTLLHAALLTHDTPGQRRAVELARLEATRAPEHAGVNDMCLCHGGAGNAHLYNRLHQATREDVFRTAACRWLRITTDARGTAGHGIGGYTFYGPRDRANPSAGGTLRPDSSFLSGSAGVGLALLAASSSEEPSWDRVLLADLATASHGRKICFDPQ